MLLDELFQRPPGNPLDLIILPEMFSTGFSMNSEQLAESMDGPSVKWMHELANRMNSAVCGSIIIEERERYYNRLLWIEPEVQELKYYDKKHLFSLAGEQNHYEAGKDKLLVNWRGWNIVPFICYDLRFPVWSRNVEHADLLIYVANFPEKRERAWNSLLPARAIENQCYVAAVNRVGMDGNSIPHRGDSTVYDFEGNKILDLGHSQHLSIIELDRHSLEVYRRAYPFLKDRDAFHFE
jgi:predicted amidohydrolase